MAGPEKAPENSMRKTVHGDWRIHFSFGRVRLAVPDGPSRHPLNRKRKDEDSRFAKASLELLRPPRGCKWLEKKRGSGWRGSGSTLTHSLGTRTRTPNTATR
jgi:hypothetical protein